MATDIYEILNSLVDTFPSWKPRNMEHALKEYTRLLGDIPLDTLEAAADDWKSSSNWFPTIAELRKASKSVSLSGHRNTGTGFQPINTVLHPREYAGIWMILPDEWKAFDLAEYQELCDVHVSA